MECTIVCWENASQFVDRSATLNKIFKCKMIAKTYTVRHSSVHCSRLIFIWPCQGLTPNATEAMGVSPAPNVFFILWLLVRIQIAWDWSCFLHFWRVLNWFFTNTLLNVHLPFWCERYSFPFLRIALIFPFPHDASVLPVACYLKYRYVDSWYYFCCPYYYYS